MFQKQTNNQTLLCKIDFDKDDQDPFDDMQSVNSFEMGYNQGKLDYRSFEMKLIPIITINHTEMKKNYLVSRKRRSSEYNDNMSVYDSQKSKMTKADDDETSTNIDAVVVSEMESYMTQFGIKIDRPFPLHDAHHFYYYLSNAFNARDFKAMSSIANGTMRQDVQLRKYSNRHGYELSSEPQTLVDFYNFVSIVCPDGRMTVKSIRQGMESGAQVIKTKVHFLATKLLFDPNAKQLKNKDNVDTKSLTCKGKSHFKAYLDNQNRVIVFDQIVHIHFYYDS